MNVLHECAIKESMWNWGIENTGLSHFLKHHGGDFEKRRTPSFSVPAHKRDTVGPDGWFGCLASTSLSSRAT